MSCENNDQIKIGVARAGRVQDNVWYFSSLKMEKPEEILRILAKKVCTISQQEYF
jgi:hypothetical protein